MDNNVVKRQIVCREVGRTKRSVFEIIFPAFAPYRLYSFLQPLQDTAFIM